MLKVKYLPLFFLILHSAFGLSQEQETKRKKFSLTIGTEYRITPIIELEPGLVTRIAPVTFNTADMLIGPSINYELGWEFVKNWSFNFSHSLRYNFVYNERANVSNNFGITYDKPIYRLIMDYNFYIEKHFMLSQGKSLYVRFGKSIANTGTRYATSRILDIPELGEFGTVALANNGNFTWYPTNAGLGYESNGISFTGGIYFSTQHEFGTTTRPNASIILPYFNLSYRLKKF
ncbi:hypothetical protein [uncultured Dokdonia sp.]|uniref:hypothetical protein n=1 Tax=uncultured Dokdonia sp. TaxID=575653 RepID=UPI00260B95A4|nr:hypothetical protein [uncultured Dokdonia sp.]